MRERYTAFFRGAHYNQKKSSLVHLQKSILISFYYYYNQLFSLRGQLKDHLQ